MNEEQELRALYKDAKSAGRVDLQEKIITRLEGMRSAAAPPVAGAPQGFQTAPFQVNPMQGMTSPEKMALSSVDPAMTKSIPEALLAQAGAGLGYYGNKAVETIAEYTPQIVKDNFSDYMQGMMKIPTNQLLLAGIQEGGKALEEAKRLAGKRATRNFEAGMNVLFAMQAGKSISESTVNSLKRSAAASNAKWMDSFIEPYWNKKNVGELYKSGQLRSEGLSQNAVISSTGEVARYKKALETVPGVSRGKTYLANGNIIQDHLAESGMKMQKSLDSISNMAKGRSIPLSEIKRAKKQIVRRFNEGTLRRSRMKKAEYENMSTDLDQIISKYKRGGSISVGDLYRVRKEVDTLYGNAMTDKRMGGEMQISTRVENEWRAVRKELNNIIQKSAPEYSDEMQRMSTLYDFNDKVLTQKVIIEGRTLGERIKNKTPFIRDKATKILPGAGRMGR